ncbi:MAG: GNAT family N-acetyltransferase [Burkholderiales bacterium]
MTVEIVSSLADIDPQQWNRLAGGNPFLRHEFLHALHETGCACEKTGWAPRYLVALENNRLTGAMPLYVKSHSRGEYVFDWAWADAYERNGLEYYPKLLSAIPFTPVTGPRILAESQAVIESLAASVLDVARDSDASSLHCLFPPKEQAALLAGKGMMLRHGVQFHWVNPGESVADFDQYLALMNHTKRKKIKQERRRVRDAGITFRWLEGEAITGDDWAFFARCYTRTYREHHNTPYLNLDFFQRIGKTMPENLLLIVAERDGNAIAASFNVHGANHLYGRYWGAIEYHPMLHFETCYYQVIEYCIARGIAVFEGGAQGEHKMARGLMPVQTCSAHWLAQPQFAKAVEAFLIRERKGVEHYIDELREHAPFSHTGVSSE